MSLKSNQIKLWLIPLLIFFFLLNPSLCVGEHTGAYIDSSAESVSIGNKFYEISFGTNKGEIKSFVNKYSGIELIEARESAWPVTWDIDLITQESTRLHANSHETGDFYFWSEGNKKRKTLHLIWNNLNIGGDNTYPIKLHATITTFTGRRKSEWNIQGENYGQATVTRLTFPLISGIRQLGNTGRDDHYFHPGMGGRLYHNMWHKITNNPARGVYPSSFATMQFVSFYDERKGGFYLSTQDDKGNHKKFSLIHKDKFLVWKVEHFPVSSGNSKIGVNYPIIFKTYKGGWQKAADIYKDWALKQPWTEKTLAEETPDWLLNITASNQFTRNSSEQSNLVDYEGFVDITSNHGKRLGNPILGEFWGWEKHGVFQGRGDYFPPYKGWKAFDRAIKELHKNGNHVRLFIDGTHMSSEVLPWDKEHAEKYAIRNFNNELVSEGPVIRMDISTNYWSKKVKQMIFTLARHGVDQVQIDGFPHQPPTPCYNRSHDHSLGLKGNWVSKSWEKLLKTVNSKGVKINEGFTIGAEGIADFYLPYVDLYHMRESWGEVSPEGRGVLEGYVDIVPAFAYVYHQHIIPLEHFNKLLSKRFNVRYHILGLSRILKWGKLPSYNFDEILPNRDLNQKAFDYLKRIVKVRQNRAKEYLVLGQMLKAPDLSSPITSIPISFPDEGVDTTLKVPSIQYSAWKANDGSIGLILSNISQQKVSLRVPTNSEKFRALKQLDPASTRITIDHASEKKTLSLEDANKVNLEVEPHEIVLVQFTES